MQCIECIAGELLIDWNPDAGKPSDVTQTFIDVPTDLPRWNGDEDVFHGRRCQSSMESSCLRQRSLDQRQCVSASFSARSSRSDRDSTRRINTEPSTDDFNQFLTVDACNGLSWSHSGDAVKPTFHDADFPETSPDGEWNLGFSTPVVSDNQAGLPRRWIHQLERTLVFYISPRTPLFHVTVCRILQPMKETVRLILVFIIHQLMTLGLLLSVAMTTTDAADVLDQLTALQVFSILLLLIILDPETGP